MPLSRREILLTSITMLSALAIFQAVQVAPGKAAVSRRIFSPLVEAMLDRGRNLEYRTVSRSRIEQIVKRRAQF